MASKTRSANCFWPRGLSLSFPTSTEGEHQQQDATDLQAEEEAEPRPDQRTETARLGPPRHLKLHTPALLAFALAAGCATTDHPDPDQPPLEQRPLEPGGGDDTRSSAGTTDEPPASPVNPENVGQADAQPAPATEEGGPTSQGEGEGSVIATAGPGSGTPAWRDEFDGNALDRDAWTPNLGEVDGIDLVPGAAGTYLLNWNYAGYIMEDDVIVSDGTLKLRNQKRPITGSDPGGDFQYSSGWIQSMHKVHYQYGYLEIRARFPEGNKVWPAFWTISEDLVWCPEFDIAEYFGSHRGMGEHLCHGAWPAQQWDSHFERSIEDVTAWHTYGLDWREGRADFYIDGQLNRSVNADYVPSEAMYIVLNNGVEATDEADTTRWPNVLEVDYIRLYENEDTVDLRTP